MFLKLFRIYRRNDKSAEGFDCGLFVAIWNGLFLRWFYDELTVDIY